MQVKKRIFAGAVCDQVIYEAPNGVRGISKKNPRPRFKTEEERAAYNYNVARRRHALLINANFGPSSYYSTLTFNNDNEVYDYKEAKILRNKYYRKLRRTYPDAKISIYMGRGKSTARIHFHMLSDGIPPEVILKKWIWGEIRECKKFRDHNKDKITGQDHGRDYTNVANYCFDHWTEEQGKGKRYKHSSNFELPEEEEATECILQYSAAKPPKAPKGYIYSGDCFITPYGYMRFRYYQDLTLQNEDINRRRLKSDCEQIMKTVLLQRKRKK